MKKIFKVVGIIAIIGIIVVLLTNISPLTIYSKTRIETKVYYTYECLNENGSGWHPYSYETYDEQQPWFTEDNINTLREIKHTDRIAHKTTYQLKGFEIIKSSG